MGAVPGHFFIWGARRYLGETIEVYFLTLPTVFVRFCPERLITMEEKIPEQSPFIYLVVCTRNIAIFDLFQTYLRILLDRFRWRRPKQRATKICSPPANVPKIASCQARVPKRIQFISAQPRGGRSLRTRSASSCCFY